jgi:hypothetical protein
LDGIQNTIKHHLGVIAMLTGKEKEEKNGDKSNMLFK